MAFKGKKWIPNWVTHDLSRRVGRGVFSIPEVMDTLNAMNVSPGHGSDGDNLADTAPMVTPDESSVQYIVEDDPQSDVNVQAHEELINA